MADAFEIVEGATRALALCDDAGVGDMKLRDCIVGSVIFMTDV